MITKEQFHNVYIQLPFDDLNVEDYLFSVHLKVMESLIIRTNNNPFVTANEALIIDTIIQEFVYMYQDIPNEAIYNNIKNELRFSQLVSIVSDKVFFNIINPYKALSYVSNQSPIISTMELNINFIINRLSAIKKEKEDKDIFLDMLLKAFLMFKSINHLLSSGFETEAFSTWRTIHELECVIKVLYENPNVMDTYLHHIVYNSAFRNEFEDKDAQQATIDELKSHMKAHSLKSKDMKKYIEYGWMYSIDGLYEKVPTFKLNFRNGLEAIAGLSAYSKDYEMSSEVAHSSPLLIRSNKLFFKSMTVVRSYESFLRLEEIFYNILKTHENVEYFSYENMRNIYVEFSRRILIRERKELLDLVNEYEKEKNN